MALYAEVLEDLPESLHVALRLFQMLLKGGLQLGRLRGLRHLRQGLGDAVFGVVEILKLLDEQVAESLEFHGSPWDAANGRDGQHYTADKQTVFP